jgi:large subunit ribosomal protein L22
MADSKPQIKEVRAHARYIHVSPQKLRLVANMIRRSRVDEALQQLRFSSKKAALPITKVINSAIANAVHNFDMNRDDLVVKAITVDGGPVMKTMTPRAQGRGFMLRKRTSHISVMLESRPRTGKAKRSIFTAKKTEHVHKHDEIEAGKEAETIKTEKPKIKQAPKSEEKVKRNLVDLKRRLFNRKSGG